jgi:hypothetical protein
MDETLLHKLIGFGASFVQDGLLEEDKVEFKAIHEKLQLLNDNQIEQIADQAAEFLVQNRDYYKFFVSTSGLLKL